MAHNVLHTGAPAPGRMRMTSGRRSWRALRAPAAKRGDVLIIADDISKTHDGDKTLFSSLTFSVVAGDKLAIVGPNGSGKSSLMRLLAGRDAHDTGTLTRNKGVTIGWLQQDPPLQEGLTVLQAVLAADSAVGRVVQSYQAALRASALQGGAITKELEAAIEGMNTYNAWEVDAEAKRILEAVGIPDTLFRTKVDALSGGQRKRVALAAALLGAPDLLFLDEPTNHMDVEAIAWMQRELARPDLAVVVISHDRAFLEATCDRLLELDHGGKCYLHSFGGPGSYERFKEARAARRAAQASAAADARTLFRRESEWMVRQPKARSTKAQARIKAFHVLTERMRDVPVADVRVNFGQTIMARQGNKVIKMTGIGFRAGDRQIIHDFSYEIMPGSRLGIVGRNGSGKSSLLNLIAGTCAPTAGSREVGDTALVGYLTQHPPPVHEDLRVIDYIREIADDSKARSAGMNLPHESPEVLLEKLGFPRPRQYQRVGLLSGGERRRLHIASVLAARPNVLILDEPTNDLDLATVEALEALVSPSAFPGVLITVSHDRAFMDSVASDGLLALRGDGLVRLFQGSYTEYLELVAEEEAEAAALAALEAEEAAEKAAASQRQAAHAAVGPGAWNGGPTAMASNGAGPTAAAAVITKSPPKKAPRKLGYYEEQEYKKLCARMDKLSADRDVLDKQVMALAQSGADFDELERASLEMARIAGEIDGLELRWLELAELAGDL